MAGIEGEIQVGRPVRKYPASSPTSETSRMTTRAWPAPRRSPTVRRERERCSSRRPVHGRTAEIRIGLTGYDRPAWLASRTIMQQAGMDGTLTFEPTPPGTRMRRSWHGRPKGAARC